MRALATVGEPLIEISLGDDDATTTAGYGGDVSNIAVMAARLGAPARVFGRVGDDGFGRRLRAFWRAYGVDDRGVHTDATAPTGLYVNEAHASGHRFTYWRTGSAGSRLEPNDLVPVLFDDVDLLVITGVTLAVSRASAHTARRAVRMARARGARVACVLNYRPALDADIGELAAAAHDARRADRLA